MRCRSPADVVAGDRGTVTAEFAVVLPAVIVVLLLALVALRLMGEQVQVQLAADNAARAFGRGDDAGARQATDGLMGATESASNHGNVVCAAVVVPAPLAGLATIPLRASACALSDGQ